MEIARIESNQGLKQSDRLFMTLMITLMNPKKAEDPPTVSQIAQYIENSEPI